MTHRLTDKPLLRFVLAIIILWYAFLAIVRNDVYLKGVILWWDGVKKTPAKARPHVSLGVAYAKDGLLHRQRQD